MTNLDRYGGKCNTLNLSDRICVPNKTEGVNLKVLKMRTGTNESKSLDKYVPCDCR